MKIQIFAEGNDIDFIKRYIYYLFPDKDESLFGFETTDGYTKLKLVKPLLNKNSDAGGINLVIFDADDPSKDHGGLANRQKYIEEQKNTHYISFETFLFPNDSNNGDFETLLEKIINPDHKCLFDCFDGYQMCIGGHENEDGTNKYNTPLRKSKIYAYVDSIKKTKDQENKFKCRKSYKNKIADFLYEDPNFWDLESEKLNPLKEFLTEHISKI